MSRPVPLKEIFNDALRLSAQQRTQYLDRVCGSDLELRDRVAQLLQAHDTADEFLRAATGGGPGQALGEVRVNDTRLSRASSIESEHTTHPQIDRYRLLRRIGEGGFGAVYLARQESPVVREVALKIIKAGMDTRHVIRRFESERQMLAVMDHPGIARILDGGATSEGRPYFVMEYVAGRSITEFCREQRLGLRQRLELFIEVCNAVQHAHQKGVIHRDLKPSNVLVTTVDGRATPRVIDFGIAKVIAAQPADATQLSEQQQPIGTPAYMSPEQAGLAAGDIDTRSDIYSLGVLLYELLTGQAPFDTELLRRSGAAEFQRMIREVDPPRPSARIGKSAGRALRGDLDWIVMKCLEKDRGRRYETASGLALDLLSHLAGEPVLAAPPDAGYRLCKFVWRNRLFMAVGGMVTLALLFGVGGITLGWVRASASADVAQREAARATETLEFLASMLPNPLHNFDSPTSKASPLKYGADTQVSSLLDEGAAWLQAKQSIEPEVEATVRLTLGAAYWGVGRLPEAERYAQEAYALRSQLFGPNDDRTLDAQYVLFEAICVQSGPRTDEAIALGKQVCESYERLHGEHDNRTLHAMSSLFTALAVHPARTHEARPFGQRTIALLTELAGADAFRTNLTQCFMVGLMTDSGELEGAEELGRQVIEISQKARGPDDYCALHCMRSLAYIAYLRNDIPTAAEHCRAASEGFERSVGRKHLFTADVLGDLGYYLTVLGRFAESEPLLVESIAVCRAGRKAGNKDLLCSLGMLGITRLELGREAEALPLFEEVEQAVRARPGVLGPERFEFWLGYGRCLLALSHYVDAERELRALFDTLASSQRPDPKIRARLCKTLIGMYEALGRSEAAEPWRTRLETLTTPVSSP